jgi:hypothetical protein
MEIATLATTTGRRLLDEQRREDEGDEERHRRPRPAEVAAGGWALGLRAGGIRVRRQDFGAPGSAVNGTPQTSSSSASLCLSSSSTAAT